MTTKKITTPKNMICPAWAAKMAATQIQNLEIEIIQLKAEVEAWKKAAGRNHTMASKYGGEDW